MMCSRCRYFVKVALITTYILQKNCINHTQQILRPASTCPLSLSITSHPQPSARTSSKSPRIAEEEKGNITTATQSQCLHYTTDPEATGTYQMSKDIQHTCQDPTARHAEGSMTTGHGAAWIATTSLVAGPMIHGPLTILL